MTMPHHPQFQGFFVTDVDGNPETGSVHCIVTLHGQPIGTAHSPHANRPMELQLPEAHARTFLALEEHLFLNPEKGTTLMHALMLYFSFDQVSEERQLFQTRTLLPRELPEQFCCPFIVPLQTVIALADDPKYAPGLVQRYVRHQGWQPLTPREDTPFQGFTLSQLVTDPADEFQCVLHLDGQALGYLLMHPSEERLQINCAPVHVQAFLQLAQTLDPADHDGSRLVEQMIQAQ